MVPERSGARSEFERVGTSSPPREFRESAWTTRLRGGITRVYLWRPELINASGAAVHWLLSPSILFLDRLTSAARWVLASCRFSGLIWRPPSHAAPHSCFPCRSTLPMPTLAFLTMHSLDGFECDDELTLEPLRQRGIEVASIPWREPTDWRQFDAVVVRSPWDYQSRFHEFIEVLRTIDRSGTQLWNPLALMEWNLHKSYLMDLQSRGVPIVPTIRASDLTADRLRSLPTELGTSEIVIKPIVGAGANRTHRLRFPWTGAAEQAAVADHNASEYLAQPFLRAIADEGEYSLVYLEGQLSHAILKTPKPGDFRSQEEFGSRLTQITPDAQLRSHGDRVLAALPTPPLYGRVDLIRHNNGFALMEVELVEPALYLSKSPGAAERFAGALASMLVR